MSRKLAFDSDSIYNRLNPYMKLHQRCLISTDKYVVEFPKRWKILPYPLQEYSHIVRCRVLLLMCGLLGQFGSRCSTFAKECLHFLRQYVQKVELNHALVVMLIRNEAVKVKRLHWLSFRCQSYLPSLVLRLVFNSYFILFISRRERICFPSVDLDDCRFTCWNFLSTQPFQSVKVTELLFIADLFCVQAIKSVFFAIQVASEVQVIGDIDLGPWVGSFLFARRGWWYHIKLPFK